MSLVIRYDRDEKVIRSTGDPPNGILGIVDSGSSFAIMGSWEPPRGAKVKPGETLLVTSVGLPPGECDRVDADEIIEGCAERTDLHAVYEMTVVGFMQTCEIAAPHAAVSVIDDAYEHYRDVLRAIADRVEREASE